ncbi:MAG: phosphatidate cytidylyltransferase [Candidatus Binatia bacterium]
MMRARVVTALVGISFLLILIGFARPWQFSLFILVVTVGALCEYFFIAFPDRRRERVLGILLGLLVSLVVLTRVPAWPVGLLPRLPDPELFLAAVIVCTFSIYPFFGGGLEERYKHLGWTLLGAFYIGFLFPHYVLVYHAPRGTEWVFFVLLVAAAGDTGGYFMGMALGRKKLYPDISPGKTVVGALGSVGASVLVGVLGAMFFFSALSWLEALFLSLVLSLLGQAGDLFESWFKRVFSVKDSGRLLPGHGGLLDRMDSLIFPAVFTSYYLRLLHS